MEAADGMPIPELMCYPLNVFNELVINILFFKP